MPPINQQGSRTGLITALVVFVVLFVVSAVFAFNYYGKYQQADVNLQTLQKQYAGAADPSSAIVQTLQAAKTESPAHFQIVNSPSVTALDVAVRQRDGLAALINGSVTDQSPGVTADNVVAELRRTTDLLKPTAVKADLTANGLSAAVRRLTDAVVAQDGQIKSLTKDKADALAMVKAKQDDLDKQTAAADQAGKAAAGNFTEQQTQLQATYDAQAATVKQLNDAAAAAVATNQAAGQQQANMAAEKDRQLKGLENEVTKLKDQIGRRRAYVDDAAVRVADGQLIRVPSNSVCYINLGYGTGVTNGLTFEVYDKSTGIPAIPANAGGDEALPVGKASIEILHVGQNSSECRIVKIQPGAVLTEGDVIENLVYDAHQKYKFDVYGNFDLANTGRPNPADAEVIKRLVTQWGGKLIDRISPDTDFLVLGAEPTIPEFNKDDLTPENQDKQQKAQEALDKYQEVRQQAKDLHIPVLNQNRFLYYVGYYDQATR